MHGGFLFLQKYTSFPARCSSVSVLGVQVNRNPQWPGKDETSKLCESGRLEDLCLKIFRENSGKAIVNTYVKDFQAKYGGFKREHKNELHALFSFTDKYVGSLIGQTAEKGGFDFDSPFLLPFLEMINKM